MTDCPSLLAVTRLGWVILLALLDGPDPDAPPYLVGPGSDQMPGPWIDPAELARLSGLDIEVALDGLADLDASGLVITWEPDSRGPVVLLSELAAEALGVELDDLGGYSPGLVWVRRSDRRPVTLPRPSGPQIFPLGALGADDPALLDHSTGPAEQAELAELALLLHRKAPDVFTPYPSVLLEGPPVQAWREADRLTFTIDRGDGPTWPEGRCPGCGGRDLPPSWCCLPCLRWGLDRTVSTSAEARSDREKVLSLVDRQRRRQLADRRAWSGRPVFTPRRWEAARKNQPA